MAGQKQINYTFKTLYFFGILFVVLGHCGGGIDLMSDWFDYYSFHMALFAFASGYFFRPQWQQGSVQELWRTGMHRFAHLLLPAMVWNVFYGLWSALARHVLGVGFGEPVNWYTLLVEPFLHNHQYLWNAPAWFVYPLFAVQCFYLLLDFFVLRRTRGKAAPWVMAGLTLAAGTLAAVLAGAGWGTGWRLPLIRTVYLLFFFAAGILYRTRLETHDTCPSPLYFALLLGIQLFLITWFDHVPVFNVWSGDIYQYGPVTAYISGLLGIAFWLRVSRLLAPVLTKGRLVMEIADNTYAVMLHQYLGFFAVSAVFALGARVFGPLADFNREAWLADLGYRYLPRGCRQWLLVYAAAGVLLPLGIARLQRWVLARLPKPVKAK